MKRLYISALAVAASMSLYAQSPVAEKYAKVITAEDAKKHLSILASDEYEGRETAKPGANMAANYIAGEFKKLGLQPPVNGSYFQEVPLLSTTAQGKSLTINGNSYAFRKDFTVGAYVTSATNDYSFNANEIIYLGHKTNYVYVIGSSMLSSDLHKINEEANTKYTKLNLNYKYDDLTDKNRYYYRSDHYNFAKHNVPIIFYFNGVHADYHQASDEIGKINFPLLAKRAQLVFYTGWELANRDKRPVVDGNTGKQ